MTIDEILEANKLIADFLEISVTEVALSVDYTLLAYGKDDELIDWRHVQYFTPNIDFNILINVLEKIEALGFRWEIGMSLTPPYHYCKIWSIGTIEGISPIDAVYGACIEFIKWFNGTQNDNKTTTSTE